MKRIAAVVLALAIHALTLAFVVGGGWLIVAHHDFLPAWLVGGFLLAIGVALRPRLGRLPDEAEVLPRGEAPELYGMAERVASAMGVRRPARIAVMDLLVGARYERIGPFRTPVVTIGLPPWLALAPRQRAALLAKACAAAKDSDGLIVEGARATLNEWRQSLFGAEPLTKREEAQVQIATSLGALAPNSSYEAAGFLGRILGRVLGWPVILAEHALTRLTSGKPQPVITAVPAAELEELEELMSTGRYLAPMQAAVLRGESVATIRQDALTRARLSDDGVLTSAPGSDLLGAAESARIDVELHAHYVRAVRGFGLIS
ncbi:hypothetical protein ACIBG8_53840 [Nonomuraea sp. NPDC050556]|uniref:hypothetical protein n=1 Tax=Nonomuraea sp. NPDC050556 TaxID=3364369 RepID=UPI0037B1B192